jgi:hypothetical protein
MNEASADGTQESTVVGRRQRTSPKALRILLVFVVLVIAWAVISGRWFLLSIYAVLGLTQFLLYLRPPTVVSATGVQRPWRLRSVIGWGQVASVAAPMPGKFAPRLNLVSGKSVALDDIPADQSALVAAIGHRELLLPPPYQPPPPSLPSQRPRTDLEVEADVERRARALAEERRRLAGES